jgi:hypothetical protein
MEDVCLLQLSAHAGVVPPWDYRLFSRVRRLGCFPDSIPVLAFSDTNAARDASGATTLHVVDSLDDQFISPKMKTNSHHVITIMFSVIVVDSLDDQYDT